YRRQIPEEDRMSRLARLIAAVCFAALASSVLPQPRAPFDGLPPGLADLPRLSKAKSRSISPENFTGEKGKGGMATEGMGANCARDLGQGWQISPWYKETPGEEKLLADIKGPGAIQQIWMTVSSMWRWSIL